MRNSLTGLCKDYDLCTPKIQYKCTTLATGLDRPPLLPNGINANKFCPQLQEGISTKPFQGCQKHINCIIKQKMNKDLFMNCLAMYFDSLIFLLKRVRNVIWVLSLIYGLKFELVSAITDGRVHDAL